jgi:ceramide glucosyltransferase
MIILGYCLAALSLVGIIAQLLGWRAMRSARRYSQQASKLTTAPSISIVKPLCGADDSLEENLTSFYCLRYPGPVEIIFCLRSQDDPALTIAQKLSNQFPHILTKFAIGEIENCANPKSSNILLGIAAASNELIWQTDSCIKTEPSSLKRIVELYELNGRGLLCCIPTATGERNLFAAVNNSHLNCYLSPAIFFLSEYFDHPCTLGKSLMFARSTFSECDPSKVMMNYLAEDYLFGEHLNRLGLPVVISPIGDLESVNSVLTLKDLVSRQLRWLTMRGKISCGALAGDIALNPVASIILAALVSADISILHALSVLLFKSIVDKGVIQKSQERPPYSSLLLLPIREFLIVGSGLVAAFNSRVRWRGKFFRLGRRSLIIQRDII